MKLKKIPDGAKFTLEDRLGAGFNPGGHPRISLGSRTAPGAVGHGLTDVARPLLSSFHERPRDDEGEKLHKTQAQKV